MAALKHAPEDWYLFAPMNHPVQAYRSAPTAWPIDFKALKLPEANDEWKGDASALNTAGSFGDFLLIPFPSAPPQFVLSLTVE